MKYVAKAFPWLLIAPVILPVVVWGGLIYPYLVPKTLLFYALELVSLGAFALLAAHGYAFYWNRLGRKTAWVPMALLVIAYVASIFGIGFYHSFWSDFVRGDGLLMLSLAVASFYLILLSADRRFFERLLHAVALMGTVVAVYGIGEWLVYGGGRIGSLLGNAAFFAGYLTIALFATLASARTLHPSWHRAATAGAVLEVIAIVLTATRGSMLALGVVCIVSLGYFAWKGKGARRSWSAGTLVALVVLAGLFVGFRSELAQAPFQPVARIATASFSSPDIASRLFIWQHMVGEIAQRPWLGVGAEHVDVLFNQFYDPTQIGEQWFDRSHNAFLDYAAQYGIGGLILYVLLIAGFFVAARRFAARSEKCYASLFALLAVAYAVQNFFVFDTVSSFWLLLALLSAALAASDDGSRAEPLSFGPMARLLSYPFALILIALIIPVSVRPALAAYDLAHGYALELVSPTQSAAYMQAGMALGTYGGLEFGYESYDMYANHAYGTLTGQSLTTAYQSAESILAAEFEQYPYDARTALYLAQVLSIAPPGVSVDQALLSAAIARAVKESPKRPQPWYLLVNLAISEANTHPIGSAARAAGYAAARDLITKYIALVPTYSEPHFVLAELLQASGDAAGAAQEAASGKQYYASDLNTAVRAAGYYEGVQDWPDAAFFLKEVAQFDPANYAMRYDLAKVEFLLGDKAASEQVVIELRALDPAILSTDPNFLSAITAYEQSLPK